MEPFSRSALRIIRDKTMRILPSSIGLLACVLTLGEAHAGRLSTSGGSSSDGGGRLSSVRSAVTGGHSGTSSWSSGGGGQSVGGFASGGGWLYPLGTLFVGHPYWGLGSGYQITMPTLEDQPLAPLPGTRPVSVQISIEDSYDFRGVNRLTGQLIVNLAFGLGARTAWTHYTERLDAGRSDSLWLGDALLTLTPLRRASAHLWLGGGALFLIDRIAPTMGWDIGLGLDLFPIRPITISMTFDAGSLNEALVARAKLRLGAVWNGIEPYLGFDYTLIGDVNFYGPLVGIKFWVY